MLSEKEIRRLFHTELLLLAFMPRHTEEIMCRVMLLAKVLQISDEELSNIVDKGYENFKVEEK